LLLSVAKHAEQWRSTLETYVYPALGNEPIADINTQSVTQVLGPIWNTKPETASRVRAAIFRLQGDRVGYFERT
jgi:hypothetical protein